MGQRVSGSRDRLKLGVAQRDHLAIGQRVMLEVHACTLGQIRGCSRSGDELGQARDVVGLHVGLEHGDDRHCLSLGERDVPIHEVDVRVHYGELAVGLAAEQVGGAGSFVIEQLSEIHDDLHVRDWP